MRRRTIFAVAALALALGGCDSFDPLDKFQDWDIMGAGKKPLQGDRRQVFPEGVPGVPQGVPPDLVKGYQAPVEAPPPQVVEEKKAKPKPRVAARPKPKAPAKTAQPQQAAPAQAAPPASGWPQPPQQQQQNAAWPTPPQQQQQQNAAWPAPQQQIPGSQPTWPTTAPPPATR